MSNRTEIHLADDPEQFWQLAESLRCLLGGSWTAQLDGLDQSYWDLSTPDGIVNHPSRTLSRCLSLGAEPNA